MKRIAQDIVIAVAVYATALCAVIGAIVSLMLRKGRLAVDGGDFVPLAMVLGLYALAGGSLALPFGIFALRGTQLQWTVPSVAIPTIAAAFVSVRVHPTYSILVTLAVGYIAMICIRFIAAQTSNNGIQADCAARSR